MAPLVLPAERLIRALSGNRFGVLDLAGLPSLRLTVAGRRTGQPRETSLLCVPHGENFLIIGSNWGRPHHPAWSTNLRAAGTALVYLHGETFPMSATELEGRDRARAWERAVEYWPGYRVEEKLAGGREFRIFELRRR